MRPVVGDVSGGKDAWACVTPGGTSEPHGPLSSDCGPSRDLSRLVQGVFLDRTAQGLKPRFLKGKPPSDADVAHVVQKSSRRVNRNVTFNSLLRRPAV